MPTQTFAHLPQEKKDRIIKAAKEEFSTYSFYDASINRIIKKAEISRGSFYLYFENKEDLLLYLLSQYKIELKRLLQGNLSNQKCDIFSLHLMIYDFVTAKVSEEEHRDFLCNVLTTMDIRLAGQLIKFIDLEEINQEQIQLISQITGLDKLNLNPPENDLEHMISILKGMLFNQLLNVLKNPSTIELDRKDLLRKFELLKTGFLK